MTVYNRRGDAPFRHLWLPYIKYVGETGVNDGIHELADQGAVQGYLEPLRVTLIQMLQNEHIEVNTTPMFMLAPGGMRGIPAALRGELEAGIIASDFFTGFQNPEYNLATGSQEALYGWMTANYSLARLEPRTWSHIRWPTTYGFVEMGGQSVQIAYETAAVVAVEPNVARKDLRITWGTTTREFKVYTKMIPDLVTTVSISRCNWSLQGNQDRCSLRGQNSPNLDVDRIGSGLCVGHDILQPDTPAATQCTHPAESLIPVFQLRCNHECTPVGQGAGWPTRLLRLAPTINFAAGNIRFVGGSSFWYASRAIIKGVMRQEHSLKVNEIRRMIIDFAIEDWPAHWQMIAKQANAEVWALRPRVWGAQATALRNAKIQFAEGHRRDALFNALLIYTTLYDGLKIPPGTTTPVLNADGTANNGNGVMGVDAFHPFNGVVGLHNNSSTKLVPYSWTLGKALYYAVGATGA